LYQTEVHADICSIDEVNQGVLGDTYDVYLVVLKKKNLAEKLSIRYRLFLQGIPNKFVLYTNLKKKPLAQTLLCN